MAAQCSGQYQLPNAAKTHYTSVKAHVGASYGKTGRISN